jgi:hypothetical protein
MDYVEARIATPPTGLSAEEVEALEAMERSDFQHVINHACKLAAALRRLVTRAQGEWLSDEYDERGTFIRSHYATPPQAASEQGVDADELARAVELAERLVMPGPKASHLSASECHEISEFIFGLQAALSPGAGP